VALEELRAGKLEISFKKPPEVADEEAGAPAAGDAFLDPPSGPGGAPEGAATEAPDEGVA
jgi:hypothetical protein